MILVGVSLIVNVDNDVNPNKAASNSTMILIGVSPTVDYDVYRNVAESNGRPRCLSMKRR